jgi:hypothetical protein
VPVSLVMATFLWPVIIPAAPGVVPFVIAQEEEASLGDEGEDLADGIVSNVLDGDDDQDQDATPDEEQDLAQDEDLMTDSGDGFDYNNHSGNDRVTFSEDE